MKIFTSNELYIQINDTFHTVEDLYYHGLKLTKGFGYIKGDYVYIYRGKLKDGEKPTKCGIYKVKGEYEFVEPRNDYERRLYDVDNVEETDPDSIFNDVINNAEDFISAEDIEKINSNSGLFIPVIKEKDDFLKKVIKHAIIEKKVNLNLYKNRLGTDWGLSNLRSSLTRDTAMSTKYFKMWCEILGLDFEIRVSDNGTDKYATLEEDIILTSDDI